jgi:hypothetical protein
MLLAATLTMPWVACGGDEVGDAFFDFVDRADREPPPPTGLVGTGVLTDIRGDYLFNISLRVIGEIFLPLVPAGALQTVKANEETIVTFTPETLAANPGLAGVTVSVPPNALFNEQGVRGGRVGLGLAIEMGQLI